MVCCRSGRFVQLISPDANPADCYSRQILFSLSLRRYHAPFLQAALAATGFSAKGAVMHSPRIGFIGMGLMGVPMSQRLLQAGFPLTVWNRNPAKTATVAAAGAVVAGSVAELVRSSDIIMLCVTDTAAVEALVFGEGGVASAAQAGQLLVDFSSIDPEATRTMAARLQQQCGAGWVDAPVSGGVAGAEQGTLAIMAGGEASDIERLQPLLAPLSQR